MKSIKQDISVVQEQLTAGQIQDYFIENTDIFRNTLFKRVNIPEYSNKLSRNAVHFCAYTRNELAGFLACYFNHPKKEFAYITTISVTAKYQSMGIAKSLMNNAIQYAKTNGFPRIRLEVRRDNLSAINMYNKMGFILQESRDEDLFLEMTVTI